MVGYGAMVALWWWFIGCDTCVLGWLKGGSGVNSFLGWLLW